MMISFGKYNVCLLDLLTDEKTGRLSATKCWYHVANVIMSKVMLTQMSVGWELLAAYGSIVGGSYVGMHLFKYKYRDTNANPPAPKE